VQEQWYGDKRDLVKWASIVYLARECDASRIIQVPFSHGDTQPWEKCRLLKGESIEVPFPQEVWDHFRNLEGIKNLGGRIGIPIDVFTSSWTRKTRDQYVTELGDFLERFAGTRLIVFLDPDTGIEPQKGDLKHVKKCEIKAIYTALNPGDCLVFYQHSRRTKNWIKDTRNSLTLAIVPRQKVQTLLYKGKSSAFAKDVAFHFVKKPRTC